MSRISEFICSIWGAHGSLTNIQNLGAYAQHMGSSWLLKNVGNLGAYVQYLGSSFFLMNDQNFGAYVKVHVFVCSKS